MSDLLRHMVDEIDYLLDQRTRITKNELIADATLQRAFTRSIEILGEAAKQLPPEFRAQHSAVPWKAIAGMRDRLIHGYFAVDYDIVWDVVQNKIDTIRAAIAAILADDVE